MDLSKQLDGFELKIRQLASKIDRQNAERQSLKDENKRLKRELDRQHGAVNSLKEKLEKLTVSAASSMPIEADETLELVATEDRDRLRAELDHCLREVELCIEWLKTQ